MKDVHKIWQDEYVKVGLNMYPFCQDEDMLNLYLHLNESHAYESYIYKKLCIYYISLESDVTEKTYFTRTDFLKKLKLHQEIHVYLYITSAVFVSGTYSI